MMTTQEQINEIIINIMEDGLYENTRESLKLQNLANAAADKIFELFDKVPSYKRGQIVHVLDPLNSHRVEGTIKVIKLTDEGIFYTIEFKKGFKHDYNENDLIKLNPLI